MKYDVRFVLKTEVDADTKDHAKELAQHDLLEQLTSMDHWLLDELAEDVEVTEQGVIYPAIIVEIDKPKMALYTDGRG